jgi:hypothetical protein
VTVLVLGVNDIPYVQAPEGRQKPKSAKPRSPRPKKGKGPKKPRDFGESKGATVTTGDVAEILEDNYGVMKHFSEMFEEEIAAEMTNALSGAIEHSMATGESLSSTPYQEALGNIERHFQDFIDQKMLDGVVEGVPTLASIEGIRSRFKNRLDPGRPSFQDTGLYERNFAAWVK